MPYHSLGSCKTRSRVSYWRMAMGSSVHEPWGHADDREPAGTRCRPLANCPSSDGNGLRPISFVTGNERRRMNKPRLPHVSPLPESNFKIFWRYSTAFGNCSLVRKIHEMAFIAGMDHWLWRRACSYAFMAPSRSPINSVRLPIKRNGQCP